MWLPYCLVEIKAYVGIKTQSANITVSGVVLITTHNSDMVTISAGANSIENLCNILASCESLHNLDNVIFALVVHIEGLYSAMFPTTPLPPQSQQP